MDVDSKLYTSLERGRSAGYLTNWAARLYAREIDAHLSEMGLSSAYLPVLFALAPLADGTERRLAQRDLARLAAVEQPTMANTLSRMARDGWIERQPNPEDRRSALISLSDKGREYLPRISNAVTSINARSLQGLSLEEATQFQDLLGRVIANLRAG